MLQHSKCVNNYQIKDFSKLFKFLDTCKYLFYYLIYFHFNFYFYFYLNVQVYSCLKCICSAIQWQIGVFVCMQIFKCHLSKPIWNITILCTVRNAIKMKPFGRFDIQNTEVLTESLVGWFTLKAFSTKGIQIIMDTRFQFVALLCNS